MFLTVQKSLKFLNLFFILTDIFQKQLTLTTAIFPLNFLHTFPDQHQMQTNV